MLTVKQENGKFRLIFANQSENLHASLRDLLDGTEFSTASVAGQFTQMSKSYFTFFVIPGKEYRHEVQKMLAYTMDPIMKLKIVNAS